MKNRRRINNRLDAAKRYRNGIFCQREKGEGEMEKFFSCEERTERFYVTNNNFLLNCYNLVEYPF